ncbi:MAG: hypothetical protein HY059_09370 [Proteobacteria bacterium]|nr:hypothetical protein [Pseudomonadota bacterium]
MSAPRVLLAAVLIASARAASATPMLEHDCRGWDDAAARVPVSFRFKQASWTGRDYMEKKMEDLVVNGEERPDVDLSPNASRRCRVTPTGRPVFVQGRVTFEFAGRTFTMMSTCGPRLIYRIEATCAPVSPQ